jgi:hypothetical protein
MAKSRQIALFVEGDSERGDARRQTLSRFFHRWLDPQLLPTSRVGITAVKFQGVSNYFDDVGQKVEMFLENKRANFVFGLVDLYGIPANRINLAEFPSVAAKVLAAREYIQTLIPHRHRGLFHQHFAVHEVEAWLLSDLTVWPQDARAHITKRDPEKVNFNEPPAKFLKRILGRYKKKTTAMNLFPKIDPNVAYARCPHLKALLDDLLRVAKLLE